MPQPKTVYASMSSASHIEDDAAASNSASPIEEPHKAAKALPSTGTLEEKSGNAFFGRSEELEALHQVKQRVIVGDSQLNSGIDAAAAKITIPAVLVLGASGTGKSRLIQQFLKETKQESPCYVLRGKYDEHTGSNDPFSAIVQALNDMSMQLKSGPLEELERIRKSIKTASGDDDNNNNSNNSNCDDQVGHGDNSSILSTLVGVVPSLSILLESCVSGSSVAAESTDKSSPVDLASTSSNRSLIPPHSSLNGGVTENVWNRLQYIFLQFVKAISTKERPIYLFLDDLQWSSPVALVLLANLISDPELKHFLLLGSIRQETNPHTEEVLEVATDSPLHTSFLSRLQSQNRDLAQIITQNLSFEDTVKFLASLLNNHPSDDNLNILAEKIHNKTHGNIFFTVQALEELQRNNILVYNQTSSEWEWNFDGAEGDDVSICNNINGVIASKLKQLPQDLQDMLSIAVYMGATFDVATLLQVVHSEQQCDASPFFTTAAEAITEDYVSTLLEKAVLEQLLSNPIGGSKYRFAHDQIQHASHSMVPPGEVRDMLRLRIGHCLLKCYRANRDHNNDVLMGATRDSTDLPNNTPSHQGSSLTEDDHGLLFVAADHLNSVPTKDHMFAVMLNLEVGEQAIQMAALDSAAAYLERAVNELRRLQNPWEKNYDISLRLYRARCDVELSLGHFQVGYDLGDEVLKKAKALHEKLPTYLSMAHGLGREDKHPESLQLCLSATTQMGEFPKAWHLGHIVTDMLKIKSFLKKYDDDAILQLPLMTDERKLMAMKLLAELGVRALMTQNSTKWLVSVCKRLRNTMQFGLCEYSAVAFASFGILSITRGDHSMAIRCAGLAKRIISKTNGRSLAGHVSFATAAFIFPFRLPIVDAIREHRRGYARAMEAGELEVGFANWQSSIITAYLAGYELQPLIQATETTLQHYKIYRVESLGDKAVEYLSMMQMMTGKKPIDWDDIKEFANRNIKSENLDPSQLILLNFHFYCRMVLATYFRRYDLACKLADSYRYVTADEKYAFAVISRGIYPGINAAGRYRETGKRKHLQMLNKMSAELHGITKSKGPKFIHHVLMLKAELMSIQKRNRNSPSVKDAYNLAIMVASNAFFIQDAALTCELAGEHCIREGCPKAETSSYFVKAVGFYEEWGCVVKVDDLKQRRSEYLTGLSENRRVDSRRAAQEGGILSNMFGRTSGSSTRRDPIEIVPSYATGPTIVGSGAADSGTKGSYGPQERIDAENDDCNLSVLTDGFD